MLPQEEEGKEAVLRDLTCGEVGVIVRGQLCQSKVGNLGLKVGV